MRSGGLKGRLSIERVAGEVAGYYGLPENAARGMVRRMRDRAYKAKSRQTPQWHVSWRPSKGRPQPP